MRAWTPSLEKGRLVQDHIEAFLGDGDKRKAKEFRNCNGGNSHIRFLRKDGETDFKMGVDFMLISLDLGG